MLVLATSIYGSSIICGNEGTVAVIDFPLFDQKELVLAGFICQKPINKFFKLSRGVLFEDVISVESGAIYINHKKLIEDLTKDHKLFKLLTKEKPLIRKKVQAKNGEIIGQVSDILFDSTTGAILKLYISSWSQQYIIPAEKIIKINNNFVEIDESFEIGNFSEASA